jgi:hypothetical protein
MNMQFKIIFLTLLAGLMLTAAGCSGSETSVNVANGNTANTTNANKPAVNAGLETTKKPEAETTNDAPTLGPVVHAYYNALKKRDEAAARKVMAQEFLKSTQDDMKAEKKTDFIAFLTEFDKIPEPKMEVRNEQINGNRGVAELKGGSYGNWTKIVFKNEGGVWKISNEVDRQ